jgi:hypothetical protein
MSNQVENGFDSFWAAYPRRVSKKDARKAWAQINMSLELLERILKALEWQVKQPQWTKNDGEFIPYPATWLRAERWDDEPIRRRAGLAEDWMPREFIRQVKR